MKLKNVFSLSLLMALPLAAAAQTNAPFPVPPQAGTPIQPRTNRPPLSTNIPSPDAAPTPAANAATTAAQPAPPPPIPAPRAPVAPAAPATPPEPADIKYNFTMPFDEVLDTIYAPLIGRTPLRGGGSMAVDKGTLLTLKTQTDLTRSEAIMALETIMGMNGITVVPIGDKFFKVVTEAQAPMAAGLAYTNKADRLPDFGKFITEIVQLKYADPDQVVRALSLFARSPSSVIFIPSTASLIMRDYTENVKRMLEMVEKLDVESPLTVKSKVIPIRYALATDISSALGQLGASASGSVGHQSSGASFPHSTTGPSTPGMGGNQPGMGAFGGQASQTGLSGGAAGRASNFANRLGAIAGGAPGGAAGGGSIFGGPTKIIADERSNSLLVFANEDDMKMISNVIDELDVILPQVLIEAIILEVNLTDNKNFGVSFLQNQSTRGQFTGAGGNNVLTSGASSFLSGAGSGSGTNGGGGISGVGSSILSSLPGGFSYYAKYGSDLNAVLEAAASDSRVSVLSRPQIQTSHAVEAEIFIGNTVPYVTGTLNYGYSSGPSVNYEQMEVGIRMRVLPLVNKDGLVTMDIDQEIEQLGPSVAIPGAGNVPTTTKRDAGAKVEVMSGDTVILGGF
ncbi:MAG: secretin N-terminal domain-containing protein, partial [Verrucomicrobiota bacterium]